MKIMKEKPLMNLINLMVKKKHEGDEGHEEKTLNVP